MNPDLGRNLLAGLVGGALVGGADALVGLLLGRGGARGAALVLFGLGAGALAGGLLVAAHQALSRLGARFVRRWAPGVLGALVLALPLVVYDGLAMFGGPSARKIPGRAVLSWVAVAAGLVAVGLVASAYRRLLARAEVGRARFVLAAALAALAVAIHVANRLVLPRLYPWFHLTLSLALLVVGVLLARVVVTARRRAVWLAGGLAAAAFAGGYSLLGRTQTVLFIAHQRTTIAGPALALLPPPPSARGRAASARGPRDQTPLPPGPKRRDADVILITVDALRPDHMGVYGYGRKTTPHLDALAARSVRFERAYTQAPHTSFATTSMMTGKYYPTLARLGPPDGKDTLPLVLRRYGWKTAAFFPESIFYVGGAELKAYASSNFHFEYVKAEFLDAQAQLSKVAEFFEVERPQRVFLWLHLFEPHEPYDKWKDHDFGNADRDRYDSEIAYADAAIGRLLAYLARERPKSIVIVSSDHGEEFDEHGGRYHGSTLYEEQVRVPLLIAVPGVPARVVKGPVELVDLAPTILGLLDIPIPLRMRGTDLGPWLTEGEPPPAERLPPAFAEVHDLRMVARATDKLICDGKQGFCAYYDLAADPGERNNLADQRPNEVAALRGELEAWLADNAALEGTERAGDGAARALERGRLGDPTAAAELGTLLAGSGPAVARAEAARLLATALPPAPETRAALLAAAADRAQADVADWSAVAAARLGDKSVLPRLTALLEPAAEKPGCDDRAVHAALALAGAGDRAGVPLMAAALPGCGESPVATQIVAAFTRLADPRATPALLARIPMVNGRREVVAALAAIADPQSLPALVELLERDDYVPVRATAASALAAIGGVQARAALARAAKKEKEPTVRDAIKQALAKL